MTSFMMPHVYGRLMPEHLNVCLTNSYLHPVINCSLYNYLEIVSKATEQYSEIWDVMSKITHMCDPLGEKPRSYYETLEIANIFKLSLETTLFFKTETNIIQTVIESIRICKKGYNCAINTGNLFSQVAIDCLYILSLCYNEVYIYKPNATSATLTDKFIVCKDFKLTSSDYLNDALSRVLGLVKLPGNIASIYSRRINNNYINTLIEANSVIGQQQLEAISNTITLIEQGKKKDKIEALKKQQSLKCAEWMKKFAVNFANLSTNSVMLT